MNAQNWDQPDVVVIGGGIAGLTAAATVAAHGKRAVVLERPRQLLLLLSRLTTYGNRPEMSADDEVVITPSLDSGGGTEVLAVPQS